VDASRDAVQQGDLRVRAVRAVVGPLTFRNAQPAPSADPFLQIVLRVYNAGTTGRLEYRSWGHPLDPAEQAVVLADDRGRTYRPCHFRTGGEVAGQLRAASIAPLGKVEDLLVFDPPAADVGFLRLELPASAGGGTGTLRLQIPRALFRGPPNPRRP
jgi:hypothetical protein